MTEHDTRRLAASFSPCEDKNLRDDLTHCKKRSTVQHTKGDTTMTCPFHNAPAQNFRSAADFEKKKRLCICKGRRGTPFEHVGLPEIAYAENKTRRGLAKCCPCCKPYQAAGYIRNANQWIQCPQCNPTNAEVKT